MADTLTSTNAPFDSQSDSDGQARGGRRTAANALSQTTKSGVDNAGPFQLRGEPAGQLLKGAIDADGKQKEAALLVGIKLDLEAEVHLTARVKGDITIGLY